LIGDGAGYVYGTTGAGGKYNLGTVFKLRKTGNGIRVLHNFGASSKDGYNPQAGLVRDAAGNLYGTTVNGGSKIYYGTVFKVDGTGTETVLFNFGDGMAGAYPMAGLVLDPAGNLYGVACGGGQFGAGTVFEINAAGTISILHAFNSTDGVCPIGGLLRDAAGNLFGTTSGGGNGEGTVFEVDVTDTFTVLHDLSGFDGGLASGTLVEDPAGNLYGTQYSGGMNGDYGTVFELTP
jgi:uncharacterized repeat protein (TIGR03803 family)